MLINKASTLGSQGCTEAHFLKFSRIRHISLLSWLSCNWSSEVTAAESVGSAEQGCAGAGEAGSMHSTQVLSGCAITGDAELLLRQQSLVSPRDPLVLSKFSPKDEELNPKLC